MQTVNTSGLVLIGVSQTSDPAGTRFLYAFGNLAGGPGYLIDFPNLSFNKNWITVAINRYLQALLLARHDIVVAPAARRHAPAEPSSPGRREPLTAHVRHLLATEDTLFVLTHLSAPGRLRGRRDHRLGHAGLPSGGA
jgi:hypothetical protein